MLMCFGEARGNASRALRLYRERYPTSRAPADSRVITAAFQRVLENQPIAPAAAGGGSHVPAQFEEMLFAGIRI